MKLTEHRTTAKLTDLSEYKKYLYEAALRFNCGYTSDLVFVTNPDVL